MAWLGRAITVIGVLVIVAPGIGLALGALDITVPWVLDYAPTFVLGGIFLFVAGVALQTFGR